MRSLFTRMESSQNQPQQTNTNNTTPSQPTAIASSSSQPTAENMTIARLISKREWSLLEHLLVNPQTSAQLPIDEPSIPHAVTPEIVVHFAARFRAPLRTISILASRYPISLDSSDATGRYPVHVASKWGATPDVIHFLIQTNPIAAGIRDDLGKTPMHYIAEYYSKNYSPRMALIHPMEEKRMACELQKEMSNRHMHVQYADDMESSDDSSGSKTKTSDTSRRIHFHRSTSKSISYVAKSA
eukprot:scaffold103_cov193-Alexandrium_tamarense.AAC.26